ncbi:MAG: flagellar motor protein MotB [Pedobacter sp.]|nr:MAG: flagellar motor protein MotB [Pedobacter sp.]
MRSSKVVAALVVAGSMLAFTSCVPKRHLTAANTKIQGLQTDSVRMSQKISSLEANISQLQSQGKTLQQQLEDTKKQLSATANTLQNTSKESAGKIAEQQKRLETLQALIDQQKKTTDDLRRKMSEALVKFNSNELSVSVKNGKVYVSLQENLLFPSGSATVNVKGKEALGKLAEVLNQNTDINVNIEGHTDSIPIRGRFEDNWALSVARATSIVRILTKDYMIEPTRIIASGHSQYDPVDANTTPEGRGKNRRTEIILTPKLDELYKLIESGGSSADTTSTNR